MKFLLSIILWAIVPMLTPQGLQIGVVNVNNKTIRIMKMNLNNPAFLQSAGNVKYVDETRFVLTEDSGGQVQLSANGSVIVEYMQDGEKVRQTYSALSDTYVPIPAGVEAIVYGSVTVINSVLHFNTFSSLDVSKNTALTDLYCQSCTGLTALDLSKNTALTIFNCSGCTGLMLLDIQNTAQLESDNIFENISTTLTTLQVAGTSAWAYEQVKSWLSGDAPNDGTILVDENTPQEVITAATAKNWTVEYANVA